MKQAGHTGFKQVWVEVSIVTSYFKLNGHVVPDLYDFHSSVETQMEIFSRMFLLLFPVL